MIITMAAKQTVDVQISRRRDARLFLCD